MKTSETTGIVMAALMAVQKKIGNISNDARNPHFGSTYASLDAVLDHVRPAAHAAGLIVIQSIGTGANGPAITTRIQHVETGEFIEDTVEMPATGDAQKWGSAITYGRRYSIPPLFLIATEDDDDANAASGQSKRPANKPENKPPQPAPGKAGGEPDTVEGFVAAITDKFAPRIGIKVDADWYNTEDHDIVTALRIAKEDHHRVMFDWTWRENGSAGKKLKYITRLSVFSQQGEVLHELVEGGE